MENDHLSQWTNSERLPESFSELLLYLRDTYVARVYTMRGLPVPSELAGGYSQELVARCLQRHGFGRGQAFLSQMERGIKWPGKTKPGEKQTFLTAANHCYGIYDEDMARALRLALFCLSGSPGFEDNIIRKIFQVLRNAEGGPL